VTPVLLSRRGRTEFQRTHVTMHPRIAGMAYGLLEERPGDAARIVTHGGDVEGFSADMVLFPDLGQMRRASRSTPPWCRRRSRPSMASPSPPSRRERQILDVIYRLDTRSDPSSPALLRTAFARAPTPPGPAAGGVADTRAGRPGDGCDRRLALPWTGTGPG
jgi:hypothetical protein